MLGQSIPFRGVPRPLSPPNTSLVRPVRLKLADARGKAVKSAR